MPFKVKSKKCPPRALVMVLINGNIPDLFRPSSLKTNVYKQITFINILIDYINICLPNIHSNKIKWLSLIT